MKAVFYVDYDYVTIFVTFTAFELFRKNCLVQQIYKSVKLL